MANNIEDKTQFDAELYGRDAKEWLERWDAGRSVFSVEMGGLGPGYEQAIQVTVAEIVRHMLAIGYDARRWGDPTCFANPKIQIDKAASLNPVIAKLGISYAQYGAALSLAMKLYRDGPAALFAQSWAKQRLIQACKKFPQG
jgi:hypothetical protein